MHTISLRTRPRWAMIPNLSRLAVVVGLMSALVLWDHASAAATTRWVNDDAASFTPPGTSCQAPGYSTIQAALDAAGAGDVIKVCPGTYVENIVVASDVTVESTAGAGATTIAPAASAYVVMITAPGVTLRGFTIVPAGFEDLDLGVFVAIEGETNVRLARNVIVGGRIGINLGCVSADTTIVHNTLTGQTEAGINIDTCEAPPFPGSHDNLIHHNVACSVTSTASIALGGSSNDNTIHHNVATTISSFGTGNVIHHNKTQAPIVENGANTLFQNKVSPNVCP